MPLSHPLINTNWYITLALMFMVAVSIFIYRNHREKFNILSTIFTPAAARDYNTPIPNMNLGVIILSAFGLIGYSTLVLYIIPAPDNWINLTICLGVMLVFFLIKYMVINLFFSVMFDRVEKDFIGRYHQYNALIGCLCFVGSLILSFTFDGSSHTAVIIAIVIGLIYLAGLSFIFLTTFFDNLVSVLRLFLYLCTLEILPLITLIEVLRLV